MCFCLAFEYDIRLYFMLYTQYGFMKLSPCLNSEDLYFIRCIQNVHGAHTTHVHTLLYRIRFTPLKNGRLTAHARVGVGEGLVRLRQVRVEGVLHTPQSRSL